MIGILDSGVGGLSVLAEVVSLMPGESTLYYADTVHCPYGGRSDAQILEYARGCVLWLLERDVDIVILACNTITAAAVESLRAEFSDMLFVGMEPAVKPAVWRTGSGVVGILATKATLRGELYRHTKEQYAGDVNIVEVAGEGLVELVERGEQDSARALELVRGYVEPMLARGADVLVLGCTHYPFLMNVIRQVVGERMVVINPAGAVARRARQLLGERNLLNNGGSVVQHIFYSSDVKGDGQLLLEKMAGELKIAEAVEKQMI